MHSNQSWVFTSPAGRNINPAHAAGLSLAPFCFGLEHQPSPRGWVESTLLTNGWNIGPAHAAGLSPALWLGQYRSSPLYFIFFIFYLFFFSPFCFVYFFYYLYIFLKVVIFARIFLRHFD
jgi:hypothetical protein